MQTPNGLNPVVTDMQIENQTTPVIHGISYKPPLPSQVKLTIITEKPMVLAQKYPPLLNISVGGRVVNIYGIFAYAYEYNHFYNNYENRCQADYFEWCF